MAVTLRSGRELEERRNENKETEEEKHAEVGEELKQQSSRVAKEDRTTKMQQEQQVEKGNLRKKKEVTTSNPQVPIPQRLKKAKLEEQFSRFFNMFKKIGINIPFSEGYIEHKE